MYKKIINHKNFGVLIFKCQIICSINLRDDDKHKSSLIDHEMMFTSGVMSIENFCFTDD